MNTFALITLLQLTYPGFGVDVRLVDTPIEPPQLMSMQEGSTVFHYPPCFSDYQIESSPDWTIEYIDPQAGSVPAGIYYKTKEK